MKTVITNNGFRVSFKNEDLVGYTFLTHEVSSVCLLLKNEILIPVSSEQLNELIPDR